MSRVLAAWWSSVAIGSGTRIAGRPTAVSSATEPANQNGAVGRPSSSAASRRIPSLNCCLRLLPIADVAGREQLVAAVLVALAAALAAAAACAFNGWRVGAPPGAYVIAGSFLSLLTAIAFYSISVWVGGDAVDAVSLQPT